MKIEDVHKTVVEVEKRISGILELLTQLGKSVESLDVAEAEITQQLNDLRRECEKEIVALKKDVEEFRRWMEKNGISELKSRLDVLTERVSKVEAAQEKIGTRAWSVVPNIVGVILNVILTAIVAFVVTKLAK